MFLRNVRLGAALALLLGAVTPLTAQQIAAIRGTVTRSGDNQALAGVVVTLKGTTIATTTNGNGKYVFLRVPAGSQTLVFRWLGYAPVEKTVTVAADQTVDATLEPKAVALGDLTVTAASKEPERIVEAPAAVSTIEPRVLQATGATGQAPLALSQTAGVDIVQSGVNDFNINARGFNSSLNRRVLTLLDGRDLAIDFLGSQEWNSLTVSTEDMRGMELVRGPGSALYGPNAFAGVLNMTTLSPREALGGRLSASVGGLSSKKVDGRLSALFGGGRYGIRRHRRLQHQRHVEPLADLDRLGLRDWLAVLVRPPQRVQGSPHRGERPGDPGADPRTACAGRPDLRRCVRSVRRHHPSPEGRSRPDQQCLRRRASRPVFRLERLHP
ncbi:MAG: carboxypeptidase-like regulatory domain-containing protein [Gemmatimonadales bacterium]